MPKPGKNETKDKFIKRCIPIVIEEGTAKDGSQASAICHSIWEKEKVEKQDIEKGLTIRFVKKEEEKQEVEKSIYSVNLRFNGDLVSIETWLMDISQLKDVAEELRELVTQLENSSFAAAEREEVIIMSDEKEEDAANEFSFEVPIIKSEEEKRLVYGVVLKPDTPDSHGDIISREEIEKAAHKFMQQSRLIDHKHEEILKRSQAVPVESFIAPEDMIINKSEVPMGSWVLVTHIPDDEVWSSVKKGEVNAYSIQGFGLRSNFIEQE